MAFGYGTVEIEEVFMAVLCLSGWKGSGKDFLAAFLVENHEAVRVALADPLKDSVAIEFSIDRASLDDPKRKESPLMALQVEPKDKFSKMIAEFMIKEFRTSLGVQPLGFEYLDDVFYGVVMGENEPIEVPVYQTPRSLAILKGSVNRSVTSSYWTHKTFEKAESYLKEDPNKLVVVTDLRYKSEVQQFKERFGDQAVFVRIERHKESPSSDPSERDLDNQEFDFYVDNTTTKENAYEQMEAILTRVSKDKALNDLARETENLNIEFK